MLSNAYLADDKSPPHMAHLYLDPHMRFRPMVCKYEIGFNSGRNRVFSWMGIQGFSLAGLGF